MEQILSKKSFSAQTFSSMNELFNSAPRRLEMTAFEYARVYDDGTASILYSHHDIAHYVIEKQLHITAHVPEKLIEDEFWYLPDSDGPYVRALREISEISSSNTFVNYIRRYFGFYEMYSFWHKEECSVAASKFINMKEQLEQYCQIFRESADELITSVDQDRFTLTTAMQPNIRGLDSKRTDKDINLHLYLQKVKEELLKLNEYIFPKLSMQEIKCVCYLFEGKTATDIAELLNISKRTVEMHLNSIKTKLNCQKKSAIIGSLMLLAQKHR